MAALGAQLIGIREAAALFGRSVQQLRKYESQGILQIAAYDGNRHLYDRAEVVLLKSSIKQLRLTEGMSLAQVSRRLDQTRGRTAR